MREKNPFFFDAKGSNKLNFVNILSVLKRRMFVEVVKNKMQKSNLQVSQEKWENSRMSARPHGQ